MEVRMIYDLIKRCEETMNSTKNTYIRTGNDKDRQRYMKAEEGLLKLLNTDISNKSYEELEDMLQEIKFGYLIF